MMNNFKKISFVGAGPGAADLLTLRALNRIQNAEVVLWTDSLISPHVQDLIPKSCEKIATSNLTLEEILTLLIDRHRSDKRIVRLHDGDPSLYGAISEQICHLADKNIDVEIIPGVSAFQATAAALKTELTIPGVVQTIVLSRANGRTVLPEKENLRELGALGATLCLYLSARHIKEVEKTLLDFYPKETPVAIGYRISWEDEWLKIVPLEKMAETSIQQGLIRTTLYLVSPALAVHKKRSKLYSPDHMHLFRNAVSNEIK